MFQISLSGDETFEQPSAEHSDYTPADFDFPAPALQLQSYESTQAQRIDFEQAFLATACVRQRER